MIQFDEHIFQMGWFNHQLVIIWPDTVVGRLWATWPAEQGILSEMLVPGSYPPAAIPEERFSLSAWDEEIHNYSPATRLLRCFYGGCFLENGKVR